jgi:phosphoglycolate phosphatase-like HAD superfamily hydrolase
MHSSDAAYFLDFDHTLFNTDQFFHVDVRGAFLRFGIDPMDWELSYSAVWPAGYSLDKHAEEVSRRSGRVIPLEEMKQVLRNSFSDLRRYVFPDVMPFLQRAKKNRARLYLLSFGNPEWQHYKVAASGLDGYFNDMFFTGVQGGKAGLIEEQAKRAQQKTTVVDNDPTELDLIKDFVPEARTYWMDRVPDDLRVPGDESSRLKFLEARRYVERLPRHSHILCRNLDGILEDQREPSQAGRNDEPGRPPAD